jgi:bacillithiol synthase
MQKLELSTVKAFPKLFLDYINNNPNLTQFYRQYPSIEGFKELIDKKPFSNKKRQILINSLENQYKNIDFKPNFDILNDEKTFTVTTGHQLNIFTGPLYIIYKIITVINLAKELKKAYPAYNFVPVYWMASEDHDFEEIASFNLFGKKFSWETEQKGAVGRMNPNELQTILDSLNEKPAIFENAYLNNSTLSDAVRQYMNELFGSKGLICIDADDKDLKGIFKDEIKNDLEKHTAFEIVNKTSKQIQDLGYETQISAREINFFYLDNGIRERIIVENGIYKVLNSGIQFTKDEILNLVDSDPQKFSPNVVLRPLYQQMILPNIAYIGGPAEVPYWLQLFDMIEHFGEPFPILMPRNFALVVNEASRKRIEKLNTSVEELFLDEVALRKTYVERNSENSLSLVFEMDEMGEIFDRIQKKAIVIDQTLKASVEAEKAKLLNSIENLEKRLKKAEERNQETTVTQLLNLKNKLFPEGGLQERKENFLNFYLNDKEFINKLLASFDPLDFKFNIVEI